MRWPLLLVLAACTTTQTIVEVVHDEAGTRDGAVPSEAGSADAGDAQELVDVAEEPALDAGGDGAVDGPSTCCCDGLDPVRFVVTCGCFVNDPSACSLGPCWTYRASVPDAGHPASQCGGPGYDCCSEPPHSCGCTYARDTGPPCDPATQATQVTYCPP